VPLTRFRSFPAYYPVISLDKAFTCSAIEVRHAHVVHTPLARRASDHLPLVIDFRLRPDRKGIPASTHAAHARRH
jgi:endonuclease/exonuclease/phosphatase family metal-dependent hydrolase